jgi:cell division protein FtsQ
VAARSFSLPRPRSAPIARPGLPGLRPLLLALVAVLAIGGGWLWLRDSTLVAVDRVDVTGISGPQAGAIRSAVVGAARDMTTLHVRPDELRKAVGPYPIVRDVTARADFPHRLRVHVVTYEPVGVLVVDGTKVPVAEDGTLLRGTSASGVPELPLRHPPAGAQITGGIVAHEGALLAAAPAPLRAKVARVFRGPRGLTARLRTGTTLFFGDPDRLRAKWAAATAVLADPSSQGATSLDLRVPERPAAGGLEQISTQEPAGGTPPATVTTPTTP